jgi:hypothetical protein
MQQQIIEQKNTIEKKKDRREGKGRVLAISRMVYKLQNTDTFYVESETRNDQYYFVKFKPDVLESWCSCKDNSTRGLKCKHLFAIEFAIKWGTIKEIDKVPANSIVEDEILDNNTVIKQQKLGQTNLQSYKLGQTNTIKNNNNETLRKLTKSYLEDDYDF